MNQNDIRIHNLELLSNLFTATLNAFKHARGHYWSSPKEHLINRMTVLNAVNGAIDRAEGVALSAYQLKAEHYTEDYTFKDALHCSIKTILVAYGIDRLEATQITISIVDGAMPLIPKHLDEQPSDESI